MLKEHNNTRDAEGSAIGKEGTSPRTWNYHLFTLWLYSCLMFTQHRCPHAASVMTLGVIPLEADTVEKGHNLDADSTGSTYDLFLFHLPFYMNLL